MVATLQRLQQWLLVINLSGNKADFDKVQLNTQDILDGYIFIHFFIYRYDYLLIIAESSWQTMPTRMNC